MEICFLMCPFQKHVLAVKISVLEGVYAQLNRLGFARPVVMVLCELRASPADVEWDIRRSKSDVNCIFLLVLRSVL